MLTHKMGAFLCALLLTLAWGGGDFSLAFGETLVFLPDVIKTGSGSSKNQWANDPITIAQAISQMLQYNPEIIAFNLQIKAREAATAQTMFLPNPALDVEVENFSGNGALSNFDSAETTINLSQLIELGGKRGLRQLLARLEIESTTQEYQARRIELIAETRKAFIEVLADQERLLVDTEQLKIAEQVSNTVKARVQSGKVSPIELTKAMVALASSRINLNKVKRSLASSRKTLAIFWGSTTPRFSEAVGQLKNIAAEIPNIEQLSSLLDTHPKIKRLTLEVEKGKVRAKQAQSSRVPDLTISGGYRIFEENNGHAFVAGFSVPLPTFDRNQGRIAEAGFDLSRAQLKLAATRTQMKTELDLVYQELTAASQEAMSLGNEVIPGARKAFEAVQEGYRQGKFSYLEVLDAQKTLFEIIMGRVDALRVYHFASIDLKRLAIHKSDF